jgi:hypothetical protein
MNYYACKAFGVLLLHFEMDIKASAFFVSVGGERSCQALAEPGLNVRMVVL